MAASRGHIYRHRGIPGVIAPYALVYCRAGKAPLRCAAWPGLASGLPAQLWRSSSAAGPASWCLRAPFAAQKGCLTRQSIEAETR